MVQLENLGDAMDEAAEDLERIALDVTADGIVTPEERRTLVHAFVTARQYRRRFRIRLGIFASTFRFIRTLMHTGQLTESSARTFKDTRDDQIRMQVAEYEELAVAGD